MHLLKYFDTLSLRPENAKELRGLILDLAIRGRLTEEWRKENPKVESVSKMLERIKIKKETLIKEKKIRRPKSLPDDIDLNPNNKVPKTWRMGRIGHIATIKGGKRIPKGYKLSDVPSAHVYIRVTDMKNGSIKSDGLKFIDKEVHELISKYTISKNDLYITIAGTIGSVGSVPDHLDGMNLTENAAKIVLHGMEKSYLQKCLVSNATQRQFSEKVNAMAQPKLALHRIASTIIPIPPISEQKAIVKIVNQLMKEVDQLEEQTTARVALRQDFVRSSLRQLTTANSQKEWKKLAPQFPIFFNSLESVDKLKESILQLAVQGKLTQQWRDQNPNCETGSELLDRIITSRIKEYRTLLKEAINKNGPKPKKPRGILPLTDSNFDEVFALPSSWQLTAIDKIGQVNIGSTPDRHNSSYWNGEINWVSSGEVANNYINFTKEKISQKGYTNTRLRMYPKGTVLVAMIGQGKTRGQTSILNINACTNQNVAGIVISHGLIIPEYLWLLFLSRYEKSRSKAKGGNQAALNGKIIGSMPIPLPPFAEQKAIVENVKILMAKCDELKNVIYEQNLCSSDFFQSGIRDVLTEKQTLNHTSIS